jgi:hypothetical protein
VELFQVGIFESPIRQLGSCQSACPEQPRVEAATGIAVASRIAIKTAATISQCFFIVVLPSFPKQWI